MYYTPYLQHHGVKGMKWGVRRQRPKAHSKFNLRTYIGNKTGHYNRNANNTGLPQNDVMAEKMGWRKLSAKESAMHQYNQTDGVANSKWVSPDGHREVVFTGKGRNQRITADVRDEGTYNYYDPQKNPIGHTVADVLPYIFLGNEANDPTNTYDRVAGSVKAFLDKPINSVDSNTKAKGKSAVEAVINR